MVVSRTCQPVDVHRVLARGRLDLVPVSHQHGRWQSPPVRACARASRIVPSAAWATTKRAGPAFAASFEDLFEAVHGCSPSFAAPTRHVVGTPSSRTCLLHVLLAPRRSEAPRCASKRVEERRADARVLQEPAVGDVQELARIRRVEVLFQLAVGNSVGGRDGRGVCRDVVQLCRVREAGDARGRASAGTAGGRPAQMTRTACSQLVPGGLQVQSHAGVPPHGRVHGELVASRVDRDLVAAPRPRDGAVHRELPFELLDIPDVVDALLELSDKTRRDRCHGNAAPLKLRRDEKVMRGNGGRGRLVDADLQVVLGAPPLAQVTVHLGGKVQGPAVHERAAPCLDGREGDPAAGQVELPVFPGLRHVRPRPGIQPPECGVHFARAPVGRSRGHHLGEVEGDHRHAGIQGRVDVADALQVIAVGPVPAFESFLENKERRVGHDPGEAAPCQCQLADGLLGQHGGSLVPAHPADVTGRCQAQAVTAANGRRSPAEGNRAP